MGVHFAFLGDISLHFSFEPQVHLLYDMSAASVVGIHLFHYNTMLQSNPVEKLFHAAPETVQ